MMFRTYVVIVLSLCIFRIFTTNAHAQSCEVFDRPALQSVVTLQSVLPASTMDRPTAMVQPPNDPSRWFIVDQAGTVSIFNHDSTLTRTGTLIDISDRVIRTFEGKTWNELGLLSIAVHPDFATNGYVYLYYTTDGPTSTSPILARLSRFQSTDNGQTLDPNSEQVIFELPRDTAYHFGGQMNFHPVNGYFYMSIGDGGRRIRSQNYDNLDGSFIRLDFDAGVFPYSIPADNPFVNGGGRDEIFAKGLRNPWRWSFDDLTGQIFLGDVGKSDWEEINLIESGKNFGWPIRQGAHCYEPTNCDPAGLTDPVVEYPHDATGGVAVIGGFVYRGTAIPSLYGYYIYADHTGRIWSFNTNDLPNPTPTVILEAEFGKYSFAQSINNELYLLGKDSIEQLVPAQDPIGTNPLPELLSMTGCFDSTSPLVVNQALIPYDINTPLWSDGAEKQRWMRLPDNDKITVNSSDNWEFPIGSVLVKNFSLQQQLIETRLFMRHDDGGWAGYTYEWNDSQTDATLVSNEGSEKQVGGQLWQYPTRIECMQCHTSVSGFTIGPETAQLNLNFTDPNSGRSSNQLTQLSRLGIFTNADFSTPSELPKLAAIDDESQTKHWRSRSYLHSNCAMCHQPGGPGRGPEDFRYAATDQQMNAINVDPTISDLGVNDAKLILPGDASKSIMALRMHSLDPSIRMPALSTSIEDSPATDIIDDWIDTLDDQSANFSQSCGQPSINGDTQKGIVLWRDCNDAYHWYLRAYAGGGIKRYQGKLTSDFVISNLNEESIESFDSLEFNQINTQLSFDLSMRLHYYDEFDFSIDPNSNTCLSFEYPVHTQIWLGADKFEVKSNNLDLQTLTACDDDVTFDTHGEPEVDSLTESGVYLWQEVDDSWVVNIYAGGLNEEVKFNGSVTSNMPLSLLQQILTESTYGDIIETKYPGLIDFSLKVIQPWKDGFRFSAVTNADLCLDLEDPSVGIYIGPQKRPISIPYSLSALGPCQIINIEGEPNINANTDEGIFVWREQDVWHMKSTTPSDNFVVKGSIQAYGQLIDWRAVSLELNNDTDLFMPTDSNRVEFRMITGNGDQDEITFVIDESVDTCFNIETPSPAPVYMGPDKRLILPPYDLSNLQPCRHVVP